MLKSGWLCQPLSCHPRDAGKCHNMTIQGQGLLSFRGSFLSPTLSLSLSLYLSLSLSLSIYLYLSLSLFLSPSLFLARSLSLARCQAESHPLPLFLMLLTHFRLFRTLSRRLGGEQQRQRPSEHCQLRQKGAAGSGQAAGGRRCVCVSEGVSWAIPIWPGRLATPAHP